MRKKPKTSSTKPPSKRPAKAPKRTLTPEAETGARAVLSGEVMPELTEATAAIFAKLVSIGCPPQKAAIYMAPALSADVAAQTGVMWMADLRVRHALAEEMGGDFFKLPVERRLELALDKMVAEAAFFVWTNNWGNCVDGEDLAKMKSAREMIKERLGKSVDVKDPMQAFAQFALQLVRNLEGGREAKRLPVPSGQPDIIDAVAELVRQ